MLLCLGFVILKVWSCFLLESPRGFDVIVRREGWGQVHK